MAFYCMLFPLGHTIACLFIQRVWRFAISIMYIECSKPRGEISSRFFRPLTRCDRYATLHLWFFRPLTRCTSLIGTTSPEPADATIRIWDAKTGNETREPFSNYDYAATYSPDGQHIISGSEDHTTRSWDAKTSAAVRKHLGGHENSVQFVVYSPDGRHAVSGSRDWAIRIWDAETGAVVGNPLMGHIPDVLSIPYPTMGGTLALHLIAPLHHIDVGLISTTFHSTYLLL
jgi:WD40 repeat protein